MTGRDRRALGEGATAGSTWTRSSGDSRDDVPRPPAFRVLIHLDDGEKTEVASRPDEAAARAQATALMRCLRDGRGDWPFVAGRFVRPERVVSVDLDAR